MTDPHLTDAWFALLSDTALPAGTRVARWNIGTATEESYLYTIQDPDSLHALRGLSTFYTPLFGPTNERSMSSERLVELFSDLRRKSNNIATIDFSPLDPQGRFFALVTRALRESGWLVDSYFCFGNWYATLDNPNFATYFQERSSKVRNTIIRARKKLEKDPSFQLVIHQETGIELERAITEFVDVYNRSWKRPEPFPHFIPGLCRIAATSGWLRLGIIKLDNRPAAAQLWIVANNTAYIVKLAYDHDYAKRTVGSVLTAALMQHVIDIDHVTSIDYLIGDDAYKRDWTPLRRERHGIIAFNIRTLHGCINAARHFGVAKLKKLKNSLTMST